MSIGILLNKGKKDATKPVASFPKKSIIKIP